MGVSWRQVLNERRFPIGAYVYSPGGDYVGYMNDDDCLYDAYDSYWGYVDRQGNIYGSYDNYVGRLTLRGEIRNPQEAVCGYVLNDGTIQNSYGGLVGYVQETDEFNRVVRGVSSDMTLVAGATAWLVGLLQECRI